MAGLTSTGLVIKSLDEIIEEVNADIVSGLGASINTSDDSVIAQIVKPLSFQMSELWLALQAIYNATDPETASDEALDRACSVTGVPRLPATNSFVIALVTGNHNIVIPASSVVEVDGTGDRFVCDSSLTLDLIGIVSTKVEFTTVANNTTYTITVDSVNHSITSDGSATLVEIATAMQASLNASVVDITATLDGDYKLNIISNDNTVNIDVSLSAGITVRKVTKQLVFESQNTGPIRAPASTLTKIVTPVANWDSVTNPLDATLGRDLETDTDYRVRRRASLAIAGASTVPAIRSSLLRIAEVVAAIVKENDTNLTVLGRPPKSFECIVLGGDDADIAKVIWEDKPVGIETYGSETVIHVDDQGIPRIIKFSRPTEIYVHVLVEYTLYSEETFPTGGESVMSSTVLSTGSALSIANDVIPGRFRGPIYSAVQGLDSVVVKIATSATPSGPPGTFSEARLTISDTEIPVFDSSRITVTEV